jgi:hypothetical protein
MLYMLFAGDCWYPEGGWLDYRGTFPSIAEAKAVAELGDENGKYDWWHIVSGISIVADSSHA